MAVEFDYCESGRRPWMEDGPKFLDLALIIVVAVHTINASTGTDISGGHGKANRNTQGRWME
jgi:hypothetical protein